MRDQSRQHLYGWQVEDGEILFHHMPRHRWCGVRLGLVLPVLSFAWNLEVLGNDLPLVLVVFGVDASVSWQ